MKSLAINSQWDDRPGNQLRIIKGFIQNFNREIEELDFSRFSYSPPLLAVYFSRFPDRFPEIKISGLNGSGYLSTIRFIEGFEPGSFGDWEGFLNSFITKSYLPVIKFKTSKSPGQVTVRDNLISHIGRMIKSITGIPMNYYAGISYLLSELTDNIVDHSGFEHGWISFQYYPSAGFMDICLGDSGIGILGSYKQYTGEKDFSMIRTHLDAVEAMVRGGSTKSAKERGFGVHTSREMLVKGLKGTFVFLSGDALLHNYQLVDFECESPGSLAFIRIPCGDRDKNFSVYNYVE